jgi:hypothetical protein
LQQFLRRRLITAAKVAALLRHGDTNPWAFLAQRLCFEGPQGGWAVAFSGRGFNANIDVAVAHELFSPLKLPEPERATAWKSCNAV